MGALLWAPRGLVVADGVAVQGTADLRDGLTEKPVAHTRRQTSDQNRTGVAGLAGIHREGRRGAEPHKDHEKKAH